MATSAQQTALDLLDRAARQADAAEVIYQHSESGSVKFQDNALKTVGGHAVRGVGLRVIHNGRLGFSSTNDLDAMDELIAHALQSAAFGQEARFAFPGPLNGARPAPRVKLLDPSVPALTMERAADLMREGIARILNAYPDAHCSGGISREQGVSVLCNSAGLLWEEASTNFGMSLDAFRVRGESFLWVGDGQDSCRFSDDIRRHADRVIEFIRLSEKETHLAGERLPVVFTPRAVEILLATFVSNVNGKMVQKGASVLAGRMGERVLDPSVTLLDDPLVDYASGSYAVDAEGVPAAAKPLFERGVLRTFVYDLQTAGLMGAAPTGNGLRGYSSSPRPSLGNLRLLPGVTPYRDILSGIRRGLLIDSALGAGQSNVLQGAFSVTVDLGFLIENGAITARVKDCMLAGNAFDAFNHLRAISAETEWNGDSELPYVCFEDLSVVGREAE